MKTGIIGLPQVGKTSLFGILTKVHLSEQAYSNPREAHIGVAKVPDERLDKLAALYHPKKLTHASVEYVDVGAIGQDALKETAYIGHLAQMADVGGLFQGVLADGAYVHVLDGGMRQLLRVVERGQLVQTLVGDFGDSDVRLARVRICLLGKMDLGQDAKQRCLANLRQTDDASFHGESALSCQLSVQSKE